MSRIISIAMLTVLIPICSLVFEVSGADACCGLPPEIVARLAEAHGVDAQLAQDTLDQLEQQKTSDLQLMKNSKAPACEAYALCGQMTDDFFHILIQAALDRQQEKQLAEVQAENARKSIRTTIFSTIGAVLGLAGFALGIYNARKAVK